MKRFRTFLTAAFAAVVPSVSVADWQVSAFGSEIFPYLTAYGLGDSGFHTLALFCDGEQAKLYTQGYPAQAGALRSEQLVIQVDGQTYVVDAQHEPPDGLWVGSADTALISALRTGNRAFVQPASAPGQNFALKGSGRSIEEALADCLNNGAAQPEPALLPLPKLTPLPNAQANTAIQLPAVLNSEITAACSGPYTLAPSAVQTGLIDQDNLPDTVLDWAGVSCASNTGGTVSSRGAGMCGAANCRIDVYLTTSARLSSLFGVGPTLVQDAAGRSVLQTVSVGNCRDGALDCVFRWRPTAQGMEVVR